MFPLEFDIFCRGCRFVEWRCGSAGMVRVEPLDVALIFQGPLWHKDPQATYSSILAFNASS